MWFLDRCVAAGCERQADTLCFECDRPFCRDHLATVRISVAACSGCYVVCVACCLEYARHPELRRLITIALPPAKSGV